MTNFHKKTFFAHVRNGPFPGRLTQQQVEGMTNILDAWETYGTDDPRHLAYVMATSFRETGAKMVPVREGFKTTDAAVRKVVAHRKYGKPAGKDGFVYYGRGQVQLTWLENYERMGDLLDIPLAENPDLAMDTHISARILIEGMTRGVSGRGDFTGKALSDYFNDMVDDPVGARRIVNGTDKAKLIAGYHDEFLEAVLASAQDDLFEDDEAEAPATKPPAKDKMSWGIILTSLGSVGASAKTLLDGVDDGYSLAAFGITAALLGVGIYLFTSGRLKIVRETGE